MRARTLHGADAALEGALALTVLLVACSRPPTPVVPPSPDHATLLPAPIPAPIPTTPAGDNVVQRVCATPLESTLRARLPSMVPCGNRLVVHAHVELNGHVLDVVGHDGDPCCTDTGPPEMMDGAAVYLDDTHYDPARHGGQPVTSALGPLTGLPDATTRPLLQALLVLRGAHSQVLSAADQQDLFTRWPAARTAVTRSPPGLTATPAGRTLRVWNERAVVERGMACRLLERHEVTLGIDGRMVFGDLMVFGEGQRLGRPCAAALPTP